MKKHVVGITGPNGFIAGHLACRLRREADVEVVLCPRGAFAQPAELESFVQRCDTIVHLAAMNRGRENDIYLTNISLVEQLVQSLQRTGGQPHLIFSSSTQRQHDNVYGRSKKHGEEALVAWAERAAAPLSVLVIPNVYGAGCKPFYNSVVATFCHQLAHGEQPVVIQDQPVEFLCVNQLVDAMYGQIQCPPTGVETRHIAGTAQLGVKQLLVTLEGFRDDYFQRNVVPDLSDPIRASLYATFLSYVDLQDHRHRPELRSDERGNLFEIIKLANGGQVFFSTTKPGVIRGDHYHTRKVEWFCVVRGEAVIRMRRVGGGDVREFRVSGASPEFISIPIFYTHNIENVGEEDLLTMFWCNEIFDAADPDTFFEKVA